MEILTVCSFYPNVIFGSRFINEVVGVNFGSRVNHPCGMEAAYMQITINSLRIGEILRIECENAVSVHIVNVHPDNITRYSFVSESVCNLNHAAVW